MIKLIKITILNYCICLLPSTSNQQLSHIVEYAKKQETELKFRRNYAGFCGLGCSACACLIFAPIVCKLGSAAGPLMLCPVCALDIVNHEQEKAVSEMNVWGRISRINTLDTLKKLYSKYGLNNAQVDIKTLEKLVKMEAFGFDEPVNFRRRLAYEFGAILGKSGLIAAITLLSLLAKDSPGVFDQCCCMTAHCFTPGLCIECCNCLAAACTISSLRKHKNI